MASLTGQTIQSTYDSLLKISGNDPLTASLQRITDGLGNFTPLYLSTTAVEISSGLNVVGSITGSNLSGTNTGDETNSSIKTKLGAASASQDGYLTSTDWSTFNAKQSALGYTPVPQTRTLTINGTAFDLSADRSWTIAAGVTSFNTRTGAITLTSGDVTGALGYTPISLGSLSASFPLVYNNLTGAFTIAQASSVQGGFLSSTDWSTFNNKLSTAIIALNGLTSVSQSFQTGTSGTDFAISSSGSVHTFNIPTASGSARGLLSSSDWTSFNNKISSQWTTSGSNIFYNTGNVGIGVSSPTTPLHIAGGSYPAVTIQGGSTGGGGVRFLASSDVYAEIYGEYESANNGMLLFRTRGSGTVSERMRITSGGNVGIGTTSPGAPLQVVGTGVGGFGLIGARGANAHLGFRTAADVFKGWVGYFNSSTHGNDVDLNIKTGYEGSSNIRFGVNGDSGEAMRITSGGNVGIGNSSPNEKLVVTQTTNNSSSVGFYTSASTGTSYGPIVLAGTNSSDASLRVFNQAGTATHLFVRGDGNVGIGTSSPISIFNVNIPADNATLSSFTVNGNSRLSISTDASANVLLRSGNAVDLRMGVGADHLIIKNSGNVGIGTTSPTDGKLQVAGNTQLGNTICQTFFGVAAYSQWITSGGAFAMGLDGAAGTTERMRITSGGNLGLGVIPSAWGNPFKVIEGGGSGFQQFIGFQNNDNSLKLGVNHYYNGSAYVYTNNGLASRLDINADKFIFNTAPSGTAGNAISFTQAMTLTSAGNVGIGQTNPVVRLQVDGGAASINTNTGAITNNTTLSLRSIDTTATNRVIEGYSISYSALFYVQNNGSYFFAGSNLSDARTKKDINYLNDSVLDKVMQLKPASFKYIQNDENVKGGFIAQDVKEIFPDLVTKTQSEEDMMGVDYYGMIGILTKAIQEQQNQINELKAKLENGI